MVGRQSEGPCDMVSLLSLWVLVMLLEWGCCSKECWVIGVSAELDSEFSH